MNTHSDDARWLQSNGIHIAIATNAPDVAAALAKLAREQLPFATAVALTRIAQDARNDVRHQLRRSFTLRSRRVEGGIQINRAEKRDWPHPKAEVGTKDSFMARHVTGGTKKPLAGTKHVAIPTKIVQRGAGGGVMIGHKPRQIRARETGFVTDAKGNPTRNISPEGPGLVRERTSDKVVRAQKVEGFGPKVARRARSANLQTVTWFLLKRQVHIKPTWPMPEQVKHTVGQRYRVHFLAEYEAAAKSARAQVGKFTSDAGRFFYLKARRSIGTF